MSLPGIKVQVATNTVGIEEFLLFVFKEQNGPSRAPRGVAATLAAVSCSVSYNLSAFASRFMKDKLLKVLKSEGLKAH